MSDESSSQLEINDISMATPERAQEKEENVFDILRSEDDEKIQDGFKKKIINHLKKYKTLEKYEVVIIYDEKNEIDKYHSNTIYESIQYLGGEKDILLILCSLGGKIEPAYFISKVCKRVKNEKFVIAVPRAAKSAATLICLGADEIHMGLLSELGPIDPQINGFPALGLVNALEKIAYLADKFPKSSELFSKYLTTNLSISHLGYFERINESASQYAQRLLDGKDFPHPYTAEKLAHHFTNHYKDHSFVIDSDEAKQLLGDQIVQVDTEEYRFADELYQFFDLCSLILKIVYGKQLKYVGKIGARPGISENKED